MSAIAGCTPPYPRSTVQSMLAVQAHRGRAGRAVIGDRGGYACVAWTTPGPGAWRARARRWLR